MADSTECGASCVAESSGASTPDQMMADAVQRRVSLSVVIPATNEPETLERCLAAINRSTDIPDEVIVVDTPRGSSPAAARNSGARVAKNEIIVFVDADVEVAPDALGRIRKTFDLIPGTTGLFGAYDDEPAQRGLISDFRNLLHHHTHHRSAGNASTFWAGLGAVRRDRFHAVGGFDERFRQASVEDIDLGLRLASAGYRILLDPAIQGKHLKRWTLKTMVQTDLMRRGIPWVRLLLRAGGSSSALNLSWRNRVSALAAVVLVVASADRRKTMAAASFGTLLLLNRDFYGLLYSRRGATQVVAGVPLHVLHHLVSVVALQIGVIQHVVSRRHKGGTNTR